jgi:hypothetical protein
MTRRPLRRADVSKRAARKWDAIAQGAPDLLDDADFAHPYPSSKARQPLKQTEKTEVQRPLVVYLRRHLPADSVVFAIPNAARSRAQIFSLMRDGMLPGAPDICVITRDADGKRWLGFIECKHPNGGRLSDVQIEVQARIGALGFPVLSECRSVEQAVAWMHQQGVPVR